MSKQRPLAPPPPGVQYGLASASLLPGAQSSAFFSVKKLKVERSCRWDMTGYVARGKAYSQSSKKNPRPPPSPPPLPPARGSPPPSPTSRRSSSRRQRRQRRPVPASSSSSSSSSASASSSSGQPLGVGAAAHNLTRRSTVRLLDTYQRCGLAQERGAGERRAA
ncbi:hypothetical protein ANANG_G00316410, partial [Anguilla anguilla]